jgi:hypothetical protein
MGPRPLVFRLVVQFACKADCTIEEKDKALEEEMGKGRDTIISAG